MVLCELFAYSPDKPETVIDLIRALEGSGIRIRYSQNGKRLYPAPSTVVIPELAVTVRIRAKKLWQEITKVLGIENRDDWERIKKEQSL